MHLKRWITGLVALPIIFSLIYWGSAGLFAVLITLVAVLTLSEYFNIVFFNDSRQARSICMVGYVACAWIMAAAFAQNLALVAAALVFNLLAVGLITVFQYRQTPHVVDLAARQVLGVTYVPVLLAALVTIRLGDQGVSWVFFILWVVAAGDTGAYYVGSYLGRHKLCPAVSPNKTIEGALGGVVANISLAWVFVFLFDFSIDWRAAALVAALMGVAGQVGDLFESSFKRAANIKDSGGLLPGHGGFWDRIDALLFAAPVALVFQKAVLG